MFDSKTWYDKLPNEHLVVYHPYFRLFFDTMHERMLIWKRRFISQKERPWTTDPILANSKFTNVYRELDRSSQWQIRNIILDDVLDLKNLVWKMLVYRIFNNPQTFCFDPQGKSIQPSLFGSHNKHGLAQPQYISELISANKWRNGIPNYDEYSEDEFEHFIASVRCVGQNPFTSAYLINSRAEPGMQRDYYYCRIVIPALHSHLDNIIDTVFSAKSPNNIISCLKSLPAVSDFIAHEFYQDFTYIPIYTNKVFMCFDQNDYTNVGPGARLGIRLIYPNLKTKKQQKQAIYRLRDIAEQQLSEISYKKDEQTPYIGWNKTQKRYIVSNECNLTLHQIEMWLCEFSKYWKMLVAKGKQRSKFTPKEWFKI